MTSSIFLCKISIWFGYRFKVWCGVMCRGKYAATAKSQSCDGLVCCCLCVSGRSILEQPTCWCGCWPLFETYSRHGKQYHGKTGCAFFKLPMSVYHDIRHIRLHRCNRSIAIYFMQPLLLYTKHIIRAYRYDRRSALLLYSWAAIYSIVYVNFFLAKGCVAICAYTCVQHYCSKFPRAFHVQQALRSLLVSWLCHFWGKLWYVPQLTDAQKKWLDVLKLKEVHRQTSRTDDVVPDNPIRR